MRRDFNMRTEIPAYAGMSGGVLILSEVEG